MKVFAAGLWTESNGLVAMPTVLEDYKAGCIWRAGEPAPADHIVLEPLHIWERMTKEAGGTFARGLFAYAAPGGHTLRRVYEDLREELLTDLRRALPVDMVLLNLHGSMAAQGYEDVEGDVLERARAIIGPPVPIGVELDLHCNVTPRMLENATVIITFKEWPHVDVPDRAVEVFRVTADAAAGRTHPVLSTCDTRMIGTFPTGRQPMRGLVDRLTALEGKNGVLSVSMAYGFPWGDVPHMTARTIVITDGRRQEGARLAEKLARDFWEIRDAAVERPEFGLDDAIDYGLKADGQPIVFADPADSMGGGNPCDSTYILARVVARKIPNVAFGPIFDSLAVEACCAIGEGASMRLRIGGKLDALSGLPVDLDITVMKIEANPVQRFTALSDTPLPMGKSVWVKAENDLDLILTAKKISTFSNDVFTGLGCDIRQKKLVFCKMWRHGSVGFENVAKEIHFVDAPGGNNLNYAAIPYRHYHEPYWPQVADPRSGADR
jgi:microcystin degradation protein MlrC